MPVVGQDFMSSKAVYTTLSALSSSIFGTMLSSRDISLAPSPKIICKNILTKSSMKRRITIKPKTSTTANTPKSVTEKCDGNIATGSCCRLLVHKIFQDGGYAEVYESLGPRLVPRPTLFERPWCGTRASTPKTKGHTASVSGTEVTRNILLYYITYNSCSGCVV